ncbi:uncharacterized protein LOC108958440 isoform X2 [Eucalyptus grandis]|uniref:uncharacterized protein LOC108958440 isoform X2 n=1 Tax=Eucalyptus grandis TaxID=71139 RepID=UPI00192ED462|nr:uncharacterized protein LOC108958440 isoform X2 [Eucalyptus grandis]
METSMDIQDSSIPNPSPEVRIDLSSEDMATDQACQDSCKTTRDCNEESNPMALQPSEIQGDLNLAGPPPDCNEESNPMASQPSEVQGDSNPAEPPPDCIVESIPITLHPSEIQGNSNPAEPSPEVRLDASSEDMAIDEASQDSGNSSREVHEESSSESMATNDSPQYGRTTTRGSYDRPKIKKRKKEKEEEGSYEDMTNPVEDYPRWRQQKAWNLLNSKVQPRAVVNENENHRSLFDAALRGDWKTIKKILNKNHASLTAKIMTIGNESFTVLDIAIMATQDQLVENLVKRFPRVYEDLNPNRALHYAAQGGRLKMVKALIDKADARPDIRETALNLATYFAPSQYKEAIWYLARRSTCAPSSDTMFGLIDSGYFDICLYLARKYPGLTTSKGTDGVGCLDYLAIIPFHFRNGDQLNFWEKCIYKIIPLCLVNTSFDDSEDTKMARVLKALHWIKISLWNLATIPAPFIKRSGESKLRHYYSLEFAKQALTEIKNGTSTPEILEYILTSGVVLDAASRGVFEIVDLCLKYFPELMWDTNFAKKLIIKVVEGRHIELFRLVNENYPIRYLAEDNYMDFDLMEAVTKWSSRCVSPDVSGAAFLMQRELQWFQAVEFRGFFSSKWQTYIENKKSYWEKFVEQREGLLKDAGQWMKDTSSSCSLVATLIITVAFAATFTVLGGNDGSKGIPIFLNKGSFMVFVVANALALFSSVTATLMFLAILTSRYASEDFLYSLPRKMILGLTFLFLSLAFMLVAFGSALMIVLSERLKWIYIPITLLAAIPIILFAILQLPLYVEMVGSTFRPHLYRPLKLWK